MPNPSPKHTPTETLLSASAIYMFGISISDLRLVAPPKGDQDPDDHLRPPRGGDNNFLRKQVRNRDGGFARISYFSYEGALFELARPTIFLVHGAGTPIDTSQPKDPNYEEYRTPGPILRTGLGWQFGAFARDLMVWAYDKGDFSIRLDMDTGPLEQILLAAESGSNSPGLSSGVMARSSGALARSSGALARSSGAMPRRSGDVD